MRRSARLPSVCKHSADDNADNAASTTLADSRSRRRSLLLQDQRTENRTGHRNGYKPRTLTCRAGKLTLRVPQDRDGTFRAKSYPFLVIDALVIKVRSEGAVRSQSALIATGIGEDGYRTTRGMADRWRYLDTALLEEMEDEEAGETTKEVTRLVSTV